MCARPGPHHQATALAGTQKLLSYCVSWMLVLASCYCNKVHEIKDLKRSKYYF